MAAPSHNLCWLRFVGIRPSERIRGYHDPGRSILLMSLIISMGGSVFLENPSNSLLFECKWFLWLVRAMKRQSLPVPWITKLTWVDGFVLDLKSICIK